VPADMAQKLNPGVKISYRVKGKLDQLPVRQLAMIPMGDGHFILPLNATLRKKIGKREGAVLSVSLEIDTGAFQFNEDFIACLHDEPRANQFFKSLAGGHQRYFSQWIDSAKTESTKVKRITMAVNALARGLGYPEMLRESKARRDG